MEAKDAYTSGHSNRVADMAFDIAKYMGIKGSQLETIHLAAHLHDIGKIGISEQVLNKNGKLLPEEWAEIKKHPEIGFNILNKSKQLKEISKIVLHHHERWDGGGYPGGLKQTEIPLGSRIIAVADSIDAMTYNRPYRKALTWPECKTELLQNSGIQFDPAVIKAVNYICNKWYIANDPQENNAEILINSIQL
jgi:putative nucleotidyltransferase with HDIG domain